MLCLEGSSKTRILGEMKGCKELVQEGMQVLEGTLGEMVVAVVGSLVAVVGSLL